MTELTNLEICKKIAEIEGFTIPERGHTNDGAWCSFMPNNCYGHYNPLTDAAIWQGLIFKYEVSISFVFCKLLTVNNGVHEKNFTDNLSLKRNALLLIIEAHNE